jgi:hypothetical protein
MLGRDQPINLNLLDIPMMADKLEAINMELEDCASPVVARKYRPDTPARCLLHSSIR